MFWAAWRAVKRSGPAPGGSAGREPWDLKRRGRGRAGDPELGV